MKKIQIINGPNLNLTGLRERNIYGNKGFDAALQDLREKYPQVEINYFQSNIEGELIDAMHDAGAKSDAIVLNGGGYTHTSVALRDAVAAVSVPVTEVHMSNIAARESFRHTSLLTGVCRGSIMGFGVLSYHLAIEHILMTDK
ncbi:MAG: type II 3-dehydroquinate dehydratase [Bacteroidales bacterium]